MMRRREFLRSSVALGALGASGVLLRSSPAAGAFGQAPDAYSNIGIPGAERAENILEIFLYGGLTTWETFYAVPEYGRPDDPNPALQKTQLYTFYDPAAPETSELVAALRSCGVADTGVNLVPFARDDLGNQVHLGPLVAPLIERADVLQRMRVVVTRHELEPHEAAIPYALCGRALGSPQMACLGAHVQRYELDRRDPSHPAPYAYTFLDNSIPTDNTRASVATGLHPAAARPLTIRTDNAEFLDLLSRPRVGAGPQRDAADKLLSRYVEQYRGRLKYAGGADPLRAARLSEFGQTTQTVASSQVLESVLDRSLFSLSETALCEGKADNIPAMSLRVMAHLLTHPTQRARYCCFIDPGLIGADGGGGYDTHAESCLTQARNLRNTLTELLSVIRHPDEQGPEAAQKLDLDKTLIILNMEFGRSPGRQDPAGRNHWPYGYVTVYLGGPIREGQKGLYGAIGPDGRATTWVTPSEHRIGALLALGIWPFAQEGYGVSDVRGSRNEGEAARIALAKVLGYT